MKILGYIYNVNNNKTDEIFAGRQDCIIYLVGIPKNEDTLNEIVRQMLVRHIRVVFNDNMVSAKQRLHLYYTKYRIRSHEIWVESIEELLNNAK